MTSSRSARHQLSDDTNDSPNGARMQKLSAVKVLVKIGQGSKHMENKKMTHGTIAGVTCRT